MSLVKLYHPETEGEIEVPERRVKRLEAKGWVREEKDSEARPFTATTAGFDEPEGFPGETWDKQEPTEGDEQEVE